MRKIIINYFEILNISPYNVMINFVISKLSWKNIIYNLVGIDGGFSRAEVLIPFLNLQFLYLRY